MRASVLALLLAELVCQGFGADMLHTAIEPKPDVLETPNYKISVVDRRHGPEGEIDSNDVKYTGINKKTGVSITLVGRTVHAIGRDGVTPSKFAGYVFVNGATRYFVAIEGYLIVKCGRRILICERGEWKP